MKINLSQLVCSIILGVMALLPFIAQAETSIVEDKSRICMMQDTVLLKSGEKIEYHGKTYYGCCPMCKQKMIAEPERYLRATDPISKKIIDKSDAFILNVDGNAVYFETESNRTKFMKMTNFKSKK